jgi:hypothetical protein
MPIICFKKCSMGLSGWVASGYWRLTTLLSALHITFSSNLLICLFQTEHVTYLPSSSAFISNLILINPLTYLRLHVRLPVMPPSDRPTSTLCLRSSS